MTIIKGRPTQWTVIEKRQSDGARRDLSGFFNPMDEAEAACAAARLWNYASRKGRPVCLYEPTPADGSDPNG